MKKKNTVLIVDDNKLNRKSFGDILRQSYDIAESENGKEALEMLRNNKESMVAIILDLVMPVMDGYEFLKKFRMHEEYKYIPVIVATTNDDVESEKKCLKLGAWDFIPKTFHPDIIWFRVINAINRSKMQALEYDTLTRVYTEQMFFQTTREMLANSQDEQFAFIRFDVDRFKMINSFYGIREGDRLLKYVAHSIRSTMESYSMYTYGRINADIFGICVRIDDEKTPIKLMQSIREKMKAYVNLHCYLETSAGCYIIRDKEMDLSAIYDLATIAAKKCKGQYMVHEMVYSEEMGEELVREQKIINEMDYALEHEQFVIYFQPKYELEKYAACGAEALVRWKKPDGTMVMPNEFIPIFEKNGFIIKLDYYVWEKVCQFIQKEINEGKTPEPISVNVSRVNLYNPKFLESIINLVEKYRVPTQYLNLELTESVFADNGVVIQEAVDYLHKAGFTIMMDDFGSGYSSLNVLKDINLDVLKIDMKFLTKGGSSQRGDKILEAVIKMADSLKMTVIAEGVEDKKQVEMLKTLGCDYIQGYYFAKPMPVEEYQNISGKQKD